MTIADIAALPVADFAEADAHLYLWAINAHLEASYSVARAWGFRPAQLLVWAKTPRGLGLGGAFTSTTEFVLFARRGSLRAIARTESSWWNWKRPEDRTGPSHSRKPDGFLDMVEQVSPGPYLEMFARRARFGWDYFGDESLGTAEMPQSPAPTEEAV
jgi:N6-adenosine-specific RNA methylase IME4